MAPFYGGDQVLYPDKALDYTVENTPGKTCWALPSQPQFLFFLSQQAAYKGHLPNNNSTYDQGNHPR